MATAPIHFPFLGGDPRRMGVATIGEADWFERGADYAAQMAEKERLLRERHDAVFAALPEAEIASRELLDMVVRWVAAQNGFAVDGETVACPRWTRAVHLEAAHPLETASLLVQEDLCLLRTPAPGDSSEGAPVLIGASLCFPSRWVLAEKLEGRCSRCMRRCRASTRSSAARSIAFSLRSKARSFALELESTTDPALFQPVALPHAPISAAEAGAHIFYRVERQTQFGCRRAAPCCLASASISIRSPR